MAVEMISDVTTMTLHASLRGLDERQRAIAANIANLETPGYLAREVSFEDSLRSAVADGSPMSMRTSVSESLAPTRLNGNNVDIDFQLLAGSETVLRQRLVTQGLNSKYALLRTAISGR